MVQRGNTIRIYNSIMDVDGNKVTPDSHEVTITDPTGTVVLSTTTPTQDPQTGQYYVEYTVAEDAELGNYTVEWKIVKGTTKGRKTLVFAVEA